MVRAREDFKTVFGGKVDSEPLALQTYHHTPPPDTSYVHPKALRHTYVQLQQVFLHPLHPVHALPLVHMCLQISPPPSVLGLRSCSDLRIISVCQTI